MEEVAGVHVDGVYEVRTGTPEFKAIEVMEGSHLFHHDSSVPKLEDDWEREAPSRMGQQVTIDNEPVFVQNKAHDIQSLWWTSIYILSFNHNVDAVKVQTPDVAKSCKNQRANWMDRVFGRNVNASKRFFFLQRKARYKEGMKWLPDNLYLATALLNLLRQGLVDAYEEYEKDLPRVRPEAFAMLCRNAELTFECLSANSKGITMSSYGYEELEGRHAVSWRNPVLRFPVSLADSAI